MKFLSVPIAVFAFIVAFLAAGTAPAATADTSPQPAASTVPARPASVRSLDEHTCQFGAYVTSVYSVDPAQDSFSARFWVWSLCPDKARDPLPGLSFPSAMSIAAGNNQYSHELGEYRHAELLQGKFVQDIDERDYPFDRQTLEIEITPAQNVDELRLETDRPDSLIAPDMDIPGWKVTGYDVTVAPHRFVGNLGNRTIPVALGHVKSTAYIDIKIARADPIGFLQIALPLWIIFIVAVACFLRIDSDPERIGARVPILAGLVFSVILNMTIADSTVSSTGITMLDQLHLLTLAVVLGGLLVNTYAWRWSLVEGEEAVQAQVRMEQHRRVTLAIGVVIYVAATIFLIWHAAATG